MSLKPSPVPDVPKLTAQIAREAFPKGNTYLRLREELGSIYRDEDFADLFPRCGQPAYAEEVGADAFYLLLLLESKSVAHLRALPAIATLRKVWTRHFAIDDEYREVWLKTKKELRGEDPAPESPYETEARYRSLSG
jgi:hypothetical protein